jgi:Response regulator containing a CheY-like receiver domain and an HTH DNA-binding domain
MREACLLPGGHEDKRRHLVAGLRDLLNADVAEWVESTGKDRVPRAMVELRVRCHPVGELLFSRRSGPPFTERDARLARWIAGEFPWQPEETSHVRSGFTRRERLVIDLLLQSHSRKEIAQRLGITVNTVQGYIKEIYRRFGVHSHAELLRYYFQTRGSNEPRPEPSLKRVARAV